MNKMHFEIVPGNWFKRRSPRPEPKSVKVVKIEDFKLEMNHFCRCMLNTATENCANSYHANIQLV